MKWNFSLACLVMAISVSPVQAHSDTQTINSKEQGWQVAFDTPTLSKTETSSTKDRYRFYGHTDEGFFVSIHVEDLGSAPVSNKDCREKYIANAGDLHPLADKATLNIVDKELSEVHYSATIKKGNAAYSMPNTHYFFKIKGYCADLHFAASPNYDALSLKSYNMVAAELKESLSVKLED